MGMEAFKYMDGLIPRPFPKRSKSVKRFDHAGNLNEAVDELSTPL